MTKLNAIALITAALVANLTFAQTAAPKKPATSHTATAPAKAGAATPDSASAPRTALPTNADVDAYMKRSFGYDPGISWQIVNIRESVVPGIAEIIVSINRGEPNHLYFSAGSQVAFVGQLLPFGPDPYATTRATLKGIFGPARGGENPPIQIVEFSDLQCPHCKAAQPVVEKLAADFPQVRFTFQQFPLPASLHPWAMKAAQYADCAAQMNKDAFWKYVNAIFENQGGIALATADDKLKELATANGLDAAKIAACAASPETDARVKKSMELGESLNVNQTPTVFINGRMVLGIASIPYDGLKNLVQFEVDHAGK
ncbi:MAG: thioredoxin domain-containing protein [Acidobacteriia bacterium]|nr:thioredoxin domain-containing protein [Terriglobia bacterium]